MVQTLQGNKLLSLILTLDVGALDSRMSPCELAAELSPETDFPSSSIEGGELENALESSEVDKSKGESINFQSYYNSTLQHNLR